MLVLNKIKQLGCICLPHKFERLYLQGRCQLADHIHCLISTKRFLKDFLGIIDAAFCNILLCQTDLIEFVDHVLLDLWCNTPCICNFKCQLFNFIFFQMLEYRRRPLRSKSDQKDRRLLYA